jgi:hypothetical protein
MVGRTVLSIAGVVSRLYKGMQFMSELQMLFYLQIVAGR